MKAETVFNVFEVLSPEEKKRFFKMCGVADFQETSIKKRALVTKEESMDYLKHKLGIKPRRK